MLNFRLRALKVIYLPNLDINSSYIFYLFASFYAESLSHSQDEFCTCYTKPIEYVTIKYLTSAQWKKTVPPKTCLLNLSEFPLCMLLY